MAYKLLFIIFFSLNFIVYAQTNTLKKDSIQVIKKNWQLFSYNNKPLKELNKIPKLNISEKHINYMGYNGNGPCNNFNFFLEKLTPDSIKIKITMMTTIGCYRKDSTILKEHEYFNLLESAITYKIIDKNLLLFDSLKNKILEFSAIEKNEYSIE